MQKKPNFADFISGNGANIAGGWRKCAMSNEKPHTDEARESVQRNCVSADASAFDLFSIVAPNGRDQTHRLLTSTSPTGM